jgi:hypothetical protein
MSTTHKNLLPLGLPLACLLSHDQYRSFLSLSPTCFIGLGWVWVSLYLYLSLVQWQQVVWWYRQAAQPTPVSFDRVPVCTHYYIALYTHPTPTASAYGRHQLAISIACSSQQHGSAAFIYLSLYTVSQCLPLPAGRHNLTIPTCATNIYRAYKIRSICCMHVLFACILYIVISKIVPQFVCLRYNLHRLHLVTAATRHQC